MSQTNIEIERMRALGMSYAEISRETGLPVGTLKSVVHRCAKKKCEECGKAVVPTKGKRAKRFCCDACRKRWHRKHPKTRGESVCPTCGKVFATLGAGRRYCSLECYRGRGHAERP